jgi:hypothetical protein
MKQKISKEYRNLKNNKLPVSQINYMNSAFMTIDPSSSGEKRDTTPEDLRLSPLGENSIRSFDLVNFPLSVQMPMNFLQSGCFMDVR